MGVIKAIVKLSELSSNSNLRLCFSKEAPKTSRKLVKLLDSLSLFEAGSRPKGGIVYLEDEEVAISLGGEQIGKDGRIDLKNMPLVPLDYFNSTDKGKVNQNDILVCKDGALTGKCCFVKFNFPIDEVMVNEHVYIVRSNETYLQKILFYLLRDEFTQFQIKDLAYRKKGQPGLNTEHLALIKIPYFEILEQQEIIDKIEIIESEIDRLISSKANTTKVINEVFGEVFGFDWDLVEGLKKNKIHKAKFIHFANDELKFDISLKTRYIFTNYIKSLNNINWISLDKIVDVKGGKRLPKGENVIEDETDFKYIRVEDLNRNGSFDLEGIKYITEQNHLVIKNYIANEKDILITIVGATVGKCGLVPFELSGENITENFARLICKDEKVYLPEYINYCLMSQSSQIQFDEYTGKSSQGKLAIFRIKKILIPRLKYEEQLEIVEKIKTRLDAQKEIDRQIEEKQQAINKIIEDAIKQQYEPTF